ncbi:hypothetical protein CK1_01260 [Ruminococcus sp. SR1/5]|nr:hypothetical protein CK1_01260 [Ruminococcus sp. SR1/5]
MEKPAVVVDNVSMKFNLSKEKVDSLKDYVIKFLKKKLNIMNSGLFRMLILR